jgi:hypothetical protein
MGATGRVLTWGDEQNWKDFLDFPPAIPPGTADDVFIPSHA